MATASASTAMRHVISLRRLAGKIFLDSENYLERTKYALNNWLRVNGPLFDTSTALGILGFTGAEAREGLAAHLEKRKPVFPQDCPL